MNRKKVSTYLPKLSVRDQDEVRGMTLKAGAIHTEPGCKWYRLNFKSKNIWAPQDLLLIKGVPVYKTKPTSTKLEVKKPKAFRSLLNKNSDPTDKSRNNNTYNSPGKPKTATGKRTTYTSPYS